MVKSSCFAPFAAALCASLFFSCAPDTGSPPQSSYCVYETLTFCAEGPFTMCQANGILSNTCPYSSSSSSNSAPSSSCSDQIQPKHQGICPDGWHIPSIEDWQKLETYVESDKDCTNCAGKYLKAASGWWDDYGFAALPGGNGSSYAGTFFDIGGEGRWWSSSERNGNNSYASFRSMKYNSDAVGHYDVVKGSYNSVRCLQD